MIPPTHKLTRKLFYKRYLFQYDVYIIWWQEPRLLTQAFVVCLLKADVVLLVVLNNLLCRHKIIHCV
jgi:hypothetical protein